MAVAIETTGRRGRLLTTAQAAEVATVSARTIQRAISSGRLVATRIGGSVRVTEADLDAFIEGGRVEVTPPPSALRRPRARKGSDAEWDVRTPVPKNLVR